MSIPAFAQLRQASTGPLRAWMNGHEDRVTTLLKRAIVVAAGRELGTRDVGAKIGGSRKDMAAMLLAGKLAALEAEGPGVAFKSVTKPAVLGLFDAHASRAAGDTAGGAYAKAELFATISARPADSAAARSGYVQGCNYLREHLPAAHNVEDVYWLLSQWSHLANLSYGGGGRVAEIIPRTEFDARYPGHDAYKLIRVDGFAFYGPAPEGVALFRAIPRAESEHYRAMAEAMGPRFFAAVRARGTGRNGARPAYHVDIRRKAEIYERTDDWSWSSEGEEPDEQAAQPKRRREFVLVREGLTGIRKGGAAVGNVTGQQLMDTFGLRGVEHGNWLSDVDSDTAEAAAFGAFADLAEILGMDRHMIGFRWKLGLALGARGSSKFAAHYEPSYRVINLTKTNGAGSLAHEWGHALDHWLADPSGKTGTGLFCSAGNPSGFPQIDAAFRALRNAMFGTHGAPVDKRRRNPRPESIRSGPIESDRDARDRVSALNTWIDGLKQALKGARGDESETKRIYAEADDHALAVMEYKKLKSRYDSGQRAAAKASRVDRRQISSYLRDAELIGDYWARPQEMFARAWESWVEDELVARGWRSTYLVVGTRALYEVPRALNGAVGSDVLCEVYPQGEERAEINRCMRELVRAVVSAFGAL